MSRRQRAWALALAVVLVVGGTAGLTVAPVAKASSGNWQEVVSDGFGDPGNSDVSVLQPFDGWLYAATMRSVGGAVGTGGAGPRESGESNSEICTSQGSGAQGFTGGSGGMGPGGGVGTGPGMGPGMGPGSGMGPGPGGGAGESSVPNTGPAQLWRSATGDPGSWTPVTLNLPSSSHVIIVMASTDLGGGYLYLGTQDFSANGPGIYRSGDGTNWTSVNGSGSGWEPGSDVMLNGLTVYNGMLYAGVWTSTGAQIWRVPYAGGTFTKVFDASSIDPHSQLTRLYPWNGKLYAAVMINQQAGVFASATGDPGTWEESGNLGGSGSGVIADFAAFNGFLYATTANCSSGGELWRTSDGITWQRVAGGGFGDPNQWELHRIVAGLNQLWIVTRAMPPSSDTLWSSGDGVNFTQASPAGGQPEAGPVGDQPSVAAFNGTIYWSEPNESTGAEIFRLAASAGTSAGAPNGISVDVNGSPLTFDVPPQIQNGRTLVPLRAIFEALGASVQWDGATRTVTATRGGTTVALAIGDSTAQVNGQEVTLDVPGQIVGGRTMVPVRFVSEALGAQVNWDSGTRTVLVTLSGRTE